MKRVEVRDYDPAWPAIFQEIRAYVWPAIADVALDIEHVGSTSVRGLKAKPVIDACIVVASRAEVPACIERLATIGYVHRGDLGVPEREAFARPEHLPRHHLYLSHRGSLSLRNHLGFRDYLKFNPAAAREYGNLKAELARKFPGDIDAYIMGKTPFVLGVLEKIGFTADEIAEIKRINQIENLKR